MKKLLCAIMLALVLFTNAVFAEEVKEHIVPADVTELNTMIESNTGFAALNSKLGQIETDMRSEKIEVRYTADYVKALSTTHDYVMRLKTSAEEHVTSLQKQIDALGPIPTEGQEPVNIADKRTDLSRQADIYKLEVAEADLIVAKIDSINAIVLSLRNDHLLAHLTTREDSIVNPKVFWDAVVGFSTFMYDIARSPVVWYNGLDIAGQDDVKHNVITASATMGAALIFALVFNIYIRRKFGYRASIESPTYLQKVSAAFWMMIARGALPAAILGAFMYRVNGYELISQTPFGICLKVGAGYLLAVFLMQAVVKGIFTPGMGQWRLIGVSDDNAKSLCRTLLFSIICICAVTFLQSVARRLETTVEMEYAVKVIASLVKASCIILVAQRFLYKNEQENKTQEEQSAEKKNDDEDEQPVSTASKIGTLITLIMSAAFVLSLFGYTRLSEFVLNRFIGSVILGGSLYIVYRLLKVILHQILSLKYWSKTLRLHKKTMGKIEFWIGFLLTPVVGLFGIFVLLGLWGVSVDILLQSAKRLLTGFYIGGIRISITSIVMGIGAFFVSLFVFRMIKNSLLTGSLSKIEMDAGVRNSLSAGIGFLGVILSIMFGLAVMGGSFGSIAIIVGAMSFGAGLGLQNVVNNFVSGIILLFERPIKIGDWVIINGQEGIVKRINIRSTALETWTKSDVIIPNADILSSSLVNMTYDSRMGRIDIAVGVSYGSDVELVKKTLLSIPLENKKVLKNPQPFVLFTDMGESSLDFQLSCYTADITGRAMIATDLRERIVARFRAENIEIPFPQRDIHIISTPDKPEQPTYK